MSGTWTDNEHTRAIRGRSPRNCSGKPGAIAARGQNVTGARAAGVTLEQQAAACIRRLQATCDHLREKLRAVREQGVSETPRTQEAGGTSHASQATAKECKSDLQSKDA